MARDRLVRVHDSFYKCVFNYKNKSKKSAEFITKDLADNWPNIEKMLKGGRRLIRRAQELTIWYLWLFSSL